jgi:hypothetical protein
VFDQGPDQHRFSGIAVCVPAISVLRIKNLRRCAEDNAPYQSTNAHQVHHFGAFRSFSRALLRIGRLPGRLAIEIGAP